MSEEFTQAEDYIGEIGDHSLHFSQHIYPATTYEFIVKLVAPELEAYESEEMESNDISITCYSNPSKLLGKKRVLMYTVAVMVFDILVILTWLKSHMNFYNLNLKLQDKINR